MMFNFLKPKKTKKIASIFDDNFIDIHSHILPGIDDGAKSINDSIELLTQMQSLGITNFVFTPHIIEGVWENTTEEIQNHFQEFKKTITNNSSLKDINIRVAAEHMMDNHFMKLLDEKDLLPIKDNKILVEMSYLAPPVNLFEIIAEIQVKGYIPILAHPERYKFFHSNLNMYEQLKKAGCLFQVNMVSLTNYYGKDVHESAVWLLRSGLIDFCGSDVHHKRHMEQINSLMTRSEMIDLLEPIVQNNHQLK